MYPINMYITIIIKDVWGGLSGSPRLRYTMRGAVYTQYTIARTAAVQGETRARVGAGVGLADAGMSPP